jgi:hypothetical protein
VLHCPILPLLSSLFLCFPFGFRLCSRLN